MIQAILYQTNTGSTEQYARLLGEAAGLPVCPLAKAKQTIPDDAEILYLGWVMANTVQGYAKAAKRWRIRCVCAVGMAKTGTQTNDVRRQTQIPEATPLFTLRGNFDLQKLHGFRKLMMKLMVKASVKQLGQKKNRTPEEDDLMNMMQNGADRVRASELTAVLNWLKEQA